LAAQDPTSPTAAAGTAPAQAIPPTAPTGADLTSRVDPNLQVLTKGAVHEAFGQPVLFNPGPNPVIPNQPPAPVEELPPGTKPAGNNVQWIPGYWSWEATQQKFVWTSGIWRVIPPGLAWVPGYWTQSGTGYQWVSGYWRRGETSIALASFSKQLGPNGPGNPALANSADIANAASAAVPNPTSNPAVPAATAPAATPTSAAGTNPAVADGRPDDHEAFFESRIRPTLLGTCAKCHGSTKARNNLRLDSQAGLLKGGDSGPAVVAGDPEKSLLIQAVRYTGEPKMPPNKKLPATVITDFERWVRDGAIFPDNAQPVQPAISSDTPVAAAATDPNASPTGTPGTDPNANPGTPGGDPGNASGGDSSNLGAVPGPDPSTNPTPGAVTDPNANPTTGTSTDPTANPTGGVPTDPNANPTSTQGASPVGPSGTDPSTNPGIVTNTGTTASPVDTGAVNSGTSSAAATSPTGVSYLPQPPASLESGPVGNPPTANFTWIPGTWIFRHGRFLWLAGQWAPIHRGWVWVPAHYVSTPAGYVFVDGYWDYELAQRGVLFAPVSFRSFHGWGFVYTPSVVLNTDLLTDCLFVNSPCGCYCFGDYYGANCAQSGIFPWFAFHMSSLGYDPFFAFSSWAHHREVGWHERLITDFRAFRDDARLRPPRTFDDLVTRTRRPEEKSELLALPFSRFVNRTDLSPLRFERLTKTEHEQIGRSIQIQRNIASKRLQLEKKMPALQPGRIAEFEPSMKKTPQEPTTNIARVQRQPVVDSRTPQKPNAVGPLPRPPGVTSTKPAVPQPINQTFNRPGTAGQETHPAPPTRGGDTSRQLAMGTTRRPETPPVVPRRPVPTVGHKQQVIQEHPAQRLSNPRYVPPPSNRGRSEPDQKGGGKRR